MEIRVDLSGLSNLQAMLAQTPAIVDQEFRTFLHGAVAHLQAEVQQRTPTNHGALRASIFGEVNAVRGIGVEGVVGTSLAYAVPVELGSRPHTPPIEPLVDWAIQKFGLDEKAARKAAFGIAYRIARRGTAGHGMFNITYARNRAQIERGVAATVRRIADRMVAQ
jgi:hypothetical protein